MNELPVIGTLLIRKGLWDRQGKHCKSLKQNAWRKLISTPKNDFGERETISSTRPHQKSIWAMLIRGKCKFLFA